MNSVNPATMVMGRLLKSVSRMLAADGLRASHFRLLAELAPTGTRITDLADRLGMTKQACGQFVRHLEGTGHVTVEVPRDDRRARVVVRTTLGQRSAAAFVARMTAIEQGWAEQVGPQRYQTFRAVLAELGTSRPPGHPAEVVE